MDLGLILAWWCLGLTLFLLGQGLYIFNILKKVRQIVNVAGSIGGEKSVEVKQIKAIEKAVAGDILAKYPEITMLLEQLSPETAEMVKKNPQLAVTLIQRYQPLIEKYLPLITGKGQNTEEKYDL